MLLKDLHHKHTFILQEFKWSQLWHIQNMTGNNKLCFSGLKFSFWVKEAAAVLLPQERRECSRVTFAAAIPEPSLLLSPLLQPCDQVTHTANCVCWEQKERMARRKVPKTFWGRWNYQILSINSLKNKITPSYTNDSP